MSGYDWNQVFQLPEKALAGDRRIPKTMLTKQALLTKTEQKVLSKMERLGHFATVQKSTTLIPPYVDDTRDVQSVLFLHCEMAGSQAYGELGRQIHKCFPNPTVILFDGEGSSCISAAATRRSLGEKGAVVLDEVRSTGPFSLAGEPYGPFLESLRFQNLSQDNLQAFLDDILWDIRLSHGVESVGFFPDCPVHERARLGELLERQEALKGELREIRQRRRTDKDLSLNESAHLRMEMKGLEKELGAVVRHIEEICNG